MVIGDRPSKPPAKTAAGAKSTAGTTVTLRVPDPKCACEYARRIASKTFEPEQAPKLPLAGCGVTQCACRWATVTERRGKVQRKAEERRDLIRFETKDNRRKETDRRKSNTRWSGPR